MRTKNTKDLPSEMSTVTRLLALDLTGDDSADTKAFEARFIACSKQLFLPYK